MGIEAINEHDVTVLLQLQKKMALIKDAHPDWFAEYEDRDPITADQETLSHLLDTAPTEFAQGLIVGIIVFRQQMSILTGRSY